MSSCVKLHGCELSALCKVLSISATLHCNPNCFFFWLSENKETIGSGAVLLDRKLSVDREKSSWVGFVCVLIRLCAALGVKCNVNNVQSLVVSLKHAVFCVLCAVFCVFVQCSVFGGAGAR